MFQICPLEAAGKHIRSKRFVNMEHLGSSFAEIQSVKATVGVSGLPQIGMQILSLAKLTLLKFYWEFLQLLEPNSMELLYCDTDSLYVALSVQPEDLDSIVRPECREQYRKVRDMFLPNKDNLLVSSMKPGIFKVEFTGQAFVSISSKFALTHFHS